MDYNELVTAITDAAPDAPVRRRMGTVAAINADRTINVTIGGSTTTITGVRYFAHYAPKVGAQVWLDTDGRDWVALGAIAGQGGATPSCKVYRTSDLSIATSTTATTVTWQAAHTDPWGMWTTGTNVVVPLTGIYLMTAMTQWNTATTGYRNTRIQVNGADVSWSQLDPPASSVTSGYANHALAALTKGDIVTMVARQTSSAALSLNSGISGTNLTVSYLGPDA